MNREFANFSFSGLGIQGLEFRVWDSRFRALVSGLCRV